MLAGRPSSRHFQNATQSGAVKPCRRHREAARNLEGVSGVDRAAPCGNPPPSVASLFLPLSGRKSIGRDLPAALLSRQASFDAPCASVRPRPAWGAHGARTQAAKRLRFLLQASRSKTAFRPCVLCSLSCVLCSGAFVQFIQCVRLWIGYFFGGYGYFFGASRLLFRRLWLLFQRLPKVGDGQF